MLSITYEQVEQLYYQNPTFGFYFLRLATARLFDNVSRLETNWRDSAPRASPRSVNATEIRRAFPLKIRCDLAGRSATPSPPH